MRLFDTSEYERAAFTWESFLTYVVYCVNIQGSALYDATLGDQEMIDQMYEQAVAEQSAKVKREKSPETEYRPPRRGYSREVEALYDMQDNIVALRAEMGRWPRTTSEKLMSKRPWFPSEVVQERMRARARSRRDAAVKAAQARWSETNGT